MSDVLKTALVGVTGVLFAVISMVITDYNRQKEIKVIETEKNKVEVLYKRLDSLYIAEVEGKEKYKKYIHDVLDSAFKANHLNKGLTNSAIDVIDKEFCMSNHESDSIYNAMKKGL